MWEQLAIPGHPGFISAVLSPGMLGLTIAVDRPTTEANNIYPGDRVDVIMVADAGEKAGGVSSRTVVEAVRVVAVGSTVMTIGRYGQGGMSGEDEFQRPDGENYTLEVTPHDAQRIAIAQTFGQLTLAMRALADSPGQVGWRGAVRLDQLLPGLREEEEEASPAPTVRVLRGIDQPSSVVTET